MERLNLNAVTLCCVDTTHGVEWSLRAMLRSSLWIDFGDAILCTDAGKNNYINVPDKIRMVTIDPLRSIEAYSDFMLQGLGPYFDTSHLLVVQWDGFVINPQQWRDEFLQYDYIGAVWTHEAEPFNVGNGGFSLRSRRLIDAWQELSLPAGHPEDLMIGKVHRQALEAHGIRFAPSEVARAFSVEDGSLDAQPFGFHGPYHFPVVLPDDQLCEFLAALDGKAVSAWYLGSLLRELGTCHRQGRLSTPVQVSARSMVGRLVESLQGPAGLQPAATNLCKSLIRYGFLRQAGRLLELRYRASGDRWADRRLQARCQWQRLAGKSLDERLDAPTNTRLN